MLPCVSLGFGGRLHIIEGGRVVNTNLTFVKSPSNTQPIGPWFAGAGTGANYMEILFGGINSIMPGALSNHKPCAFYYGDLYTTLHTISEAPRVFLTKFDGSGVFKHGGFTGTNGYAANWRNGRGTQLISPSGTLDIGFQSCAHIVHNGVLFVLGATPLITFPITEWTNMGWVGPTIANGTDQTDRRRRRRYGGFVISKNEKQGTVDKRILQPLPELANATTQEDTHACDAISFSNDIYFTSHIDLLRYPGGSGIPELIESTVNIPSPKCFEIYPSGGFSNGDPVFDPTTNHADLLMLSSSGVLKSIIFRTNESPSGTRTLIDLGLLVQDAGTLIKDVRTGTMLSRVTSSTAEPPRSCFLKTFNSKLNAFFPSATSGYYHFQCEGDPRDSNNWTNVTNDMFEDVRRFDGDLYGFHDNFRDVLYVMHISKSEYGLFGTVGGQNGAGGMHLSELNKNNEWREIYRGVSAEPSVGLIPYNFIGPYSQAPSGSNPQVIASTDYALLTYKLYSPYPRTVNVDIEYTINKGITWHTAKRFKSYDTATLLGEGKTNLSASFFGQEHTFYWDYINDIGFNNVKEAKLRIRVKLVR